MRPGSVNDVATVLEGVRNVAGKRRANQIPRHLEYCSATPAPNISRWSTALRNCCPYQLAGGAAYSGERRILTDRIPPFGASRSDVQFE